MSDVEMILCDADGNLFPSEEPAFEASAVVTNRLLQDLGADRRFAAGALRAAAMGRTFRATATWLATEEGSALEPARLERYVEAERREVSARLARVLAPDPSVRRALEDLSERFRLAVVSSSALQRLAVCFTATGLDDILPPAVRISAEDSLEVPTSKPDPAVYAYAARHFGIEPEQALAIEDAVSGVRSAVTAGMSVIGNLHFVAADERQARAAALLEAGASAVAASWDEVSACCRRAGAGSAVTRGPVGHRRGHRSSHDRRHRHAADAAPFE